MRAQSLRHTRTRAHTHLSAFLCITSHLPSSPSQCPPTHVSFNQAYIHKQGGVKIPANLPRSWNANVCPELLLTDGALLSALHYIVLFERSRYLLVIFVSLCFYAFYCNCRCYCRMYSIQNVSSRWTYWYCMFHSMLDKTSQIIILL